MYEYSSPRQASTLYYYRVGGDGPREIGTVTTFGFDFSSVNVQVVKYPSTDGAMIPALLYLPPKVAKDGKNAALVIYHGGPPDQSRPYFQRNIAFALTKGMILLFPNVRGSTGYGTAYERADNREGRFQALADAAAALDYLVREGYSSYHRIGIWGASYGGYTVNYLATVFPDKFACAVSEVGVADPDYSNTHGDITFQRGWEQEYGPIGSKLTYELAPIYKAQNVNKPILLTGGFNDPRVFPGDPRRFAYVLSRLGKDVLYYEDLTSGHWGTSKQAVIDGYARAYVFFLEHLAK